MTPLFRVALRCLTAVLFLFALTMAAKGLRYAWLVSDGEGDMRQRLHEYEVFRRGVYPEPEIDSEIAPGAWVPRSVYPPYALPMFVPFFEPFGRVQGRIVVELLSCLSLIAIAAYGHKFLSDAGSDAARLGAVAALAISGNGNALALGQFSIICAGALLMQIVMLERGRPLAAGAWWSLAMLKPQIGLAFAALFLVRREWRALACGLSILLGLSLAACWWTEVSPRKVVEYWLLHMNVGFAEGYSIPSRLAAVLGFHSRALHLVLAGLPLLLLPALFWKRPFAAIPVDPLPVAAAAALFGGSLLYHPFYDNVMMFSLLFVAIAYAARRPTTLAVGIAAMVGVSLWTPQQVVDRLPWHWLLRPAIWTVCAATLFALHVRSTVTDTRTALTNDLA